jgi:hypothetical protein
MHRALCRRHIQKSCIEIGAKALHLTRQECTPISLQNPVTLGANHSRQIRRVELSCRRG